MKKTKKFYKLYQRQFKNFSRYRQRNRSGVFLMALVILISFLAMGAANVRAAARYAPGQTLTPDCGPTDPDCTVSSPLYTSAFLDIGSSPQAGYYTATSTTATSVLAGGLSVAGTAGLTVLTSGYVGIGTTSPQSKLTVISANTNPSLAHGTAASATIGAVAGNQMSIGAYSASPYGMWLQVGHTVADVSGTLSLNPLGGNVGIGTTTPSAQFEISSGISGINDRIRFITAGGVSNRTLDFDRTLATTGWSIQSRLTSSSIAYANLLLNPLGGNVGIGTTTPQTKLAVLGGVTTDYIGDINIKDYYVFGDSITAANVYPRQIASSLGYTLTNKGVSGSVLEETGQIDNIYATSISTTTVSTILTGYNNHRYYGTSASYLDVYKKSLPVALAYLSIPDGNKKWANDASVTLTGSWVATSTYGLSSKSYYTNTLNDTASTTVSGEAIYVAGTQVKSGGGSFSLIIDGTTYGPYSCNSAQSTYTSARTYSPFMMRVANLTNGQHYVTVKLTTAGYCEINWFGGLAYERVSSGPSVYVGNALRMTDANYIAHSPVGSIEANRLYNQVIGKTVRMLAQDGLNVALVDVDNAFDPATDMVSTDFVHPSTWGNNVIGDAFLEKMSKGATAQEKQGGSFFGSNTPTFSFGIAPNAFTFDMDNYRLGLGTSSPASKLSVSGGASIGADYNIDAPTNGLIVEGNVGIGTTTPSAKLEIASGSIPGIEDRVRFITAGGGTNRTLNFDRTLYPGNWSIQSNITNSGVVANLYINPLGGNVILAGGNNVGIGTTSPGTKLHIESTTPILRMSQTAGQSAPSSITQGMQGIELLGGNINIENGFKYSGAVKFGSTDSSFTTTNPKFLAGIVGRATETYSVDSNSGMGIDFLTTPNTAGVTPIPSTRMTIDQNGNVGIGTTSPMSKFSIFQSSNTIAGGISLSSLASSTRSIYMDDSNILHFSGNGTDGTLNASGVWTDSSDIAYKNNIIDMKYGLTDLLKLEPKQYTMKVSGIPQIGLIAQDVEKVIPEVVSGEEGHKGIAYGQLTALLIQAVKEISTKLDNFIANGIANIKNLVVESVTAAVGKFTEKLCVGNTCVTENQLKSLLQNANLSGVSPDSTPTPTPTPSPSPIPTPDTIAEPETPIPTPTPSPTPTPEPTPPSVDSGQATPTPSSADSTPSASSGQESSEQATPSQVEDNAAATGAAD